MADTRETLYSLDRSDCSLSHWAGLRSRDVTRVVRLSVGRHDLPARRRRRRGAVGQRTAGSPTVEGGRQGRGREREAEGN